MSTTQDQHLIEAAWRGHAETLAGLLAAGADIHAEDDAALREAAYQGHLEVVAALLAAGADVHARGDQALRDAAWRGHVEVVRALLAAGANVVHTREDQALRWAAYPGHAEVLRALLGADHVYDAGADPRGYRFLGLRLDDGITVGAGCRWRHLDRARLHWASNPDALARVERIAEWGDGQ